MTDINKLERFFGTKKPTLSTSSGYPCIKMQVSLRAEEYIGVFGYGTESTPDYFRLLLSALSGEIVDVTFFGLTPTPNISGSTNEVQLSQAIDRFLSDKERSKRFADYNQDDLDKMKSVVMDKFASGELGFHLKYSQISPMIDDFKEYLEYHNLSL